MPTCTPHLPHAPTQGSYWFNFDFVHYWMEALPRYLSQITETEAVTVLASAGRRGGVVTVQTSSNGGVNANEGLLALLQAQGRPLQLFSGKDPRSSSTHAHSHQAHVSSISLSIFRSLLELLSHAGRFYSNLYDFDRLQPSLVPFFRSTHTHTYTRSASALPLFYHLSSASQRELLQLLTYFRRWTLPLVKGAAQCSRSSSVDADTRLFFVEVARLALERGAVSCESFLSFMFSVLRGEQGQASHGEGRGQSSARPSARAESGTDSKGASSSSVRRHHRQQQQ